MSRGENATLSPVSVVDHVLQEWLGLPKVGPLIDAVAPTNVLGNKLGVPLPGPLLEEQLHRLNSSISRGRLPDPRSLLPGRR